MTGNMYHTSTNYTSNKQQTIKSKYRSAAVFNAILTPDGGQCRPKHVMCTEDKVKMSQLLIKVLKFMLYL
jgi:hypothetical protein